MCTRTKKLFKNRAPPPRGLSAIAWAKRSIFMRFTPYQRHLYLSRMRPLRIVQDGGCAERTKSGVEMISKPHREGLLWFYLEVHLLQSAFHLLQSLANARGQTVLFGYGIVSFVSLQVFTTRFDEIFKSCSYQLSSSFLSARAFCNSLLCFLVRLCVSLFSVYYFNIISVFYIWVCCCWRYFIFTSGDNLDFIFFLLYPGLLTPVRVIDRSQLHI